MATAVMTDADALTDTIRRDGYVVVRNRLDPGVVEQARRDLDALYAQDLKARERQNRPEVYFAGPHGTSYLTEPTHLMLGLAGKSAALDRLLEQILTDGESGELLRNLIGDSVKFRDINCRLMTGVEDKGDLLNPPHEWHRDSPGEICIGIYMNEVPPGDHAATALIPGSHRYPWCPRWNALFGLPFRLDPTGRQGMKFLTRLNPFSRLLARRVLRNATGAFGKPGDFYIFINDTWHGRLPNKAGSKAMVVLAGGFPTDFPFPDKVVPPPAAEAAKMPAALRQAMRGDGPINHRTDTIIHEMLRERAPDRRFSLFWLARMERRVMVKASKLIDPTGIFGVAGHIGSRRVIKALSRRAQGMARRAARRLGIRRTAAGG